MSKCEPSKPGKSYRNIHYANERIRELELELDQLRATLIAVAAFVERLDVQSKVDDGR